MIIRVILLIVINKLRNYISDSQADLRHKKNNCIYFRVYLARQLTDKGPEDVG